MLQEGIGKTAQYIQYLENQVIQAGQQNKELQAQLSAKDRELVAAQQTPVKESQSQIDALETKLRAFAVQNSELDENLKRLTKDNQGLQEELDRLRAENENVQKALQELLAKQASLQELTKELQASKKLKSGLQHIMGSLGAPTTKENLFELVSDALQNISTTYMPLKSFHTMFKDLYTRPPSQKLSPYVQFKRQAPSICATNNQVFIDFMNKIDSMVVQATKIDSTIEQELQRQGYSIKK